MLDVALEDEDVPWVKLDELPGVKVVALAPDCTITFHGKKCLLLKRIAVGHVHTHVITTATPP